MIKIIDIDSLNIQNLLFLMNLIEGLDNSFKKCFKLYSE